MGGGEKWGRVLVFVVRARHVPPPSPRGYSSTLPRVMQHTYTYIYTCVSLYSWRDVYVCEIPSFFLPFLPFFETDGRLTAERTRTSHVCNIDIIASISPRRVGPAVAGRDGGGGAQQGGRELVIECRYLPPTRTASTCSPPPPPPPRFGRLVRPPSVGRLCPNLPP